MDDSHSDVNPMRRLLLALLPGLMLTDEVLAQDATLVQPESYRTVYENDKLRVVEVRSRPGMGVCGHGMHSHPPHLTVVLADGNVRRTTPDGKSMVRSGKIGDVTWSEAETHEVENLSGRNSRAVLIELKAAKV